MGAKQKLKGFHAQLILTLEERLHDTGNYSEIEKGVSYLTRDACGEIDLYAVRGNRVLVFEIKSSDCRANRKKAEKQLKRAATNYHLFHHKDCILFYAYWTDYREGEYGLERVCF